MSIKEKIITFFTGKTKKERDLEMTMISYLERQLAHSQLELEAIQKGNLKEARRLVRLRQELK